MTALMLGANTVLSSNRCQVSIESTLALGQTIGSLWLPLDANHQVVTQAVYSHGESTAWASFQQSHWQLALDKLFGEYPNITAVQLVIYAYYDANLILPAVEINDIKLTINHEITYTFAVAERHIKSAVVLEVYQRNGEFKCRALAACSEQPLHQLLPKLKTSLDARHPNLTAAQNPSPNMTMPTTPQSGDTWTGTAFAIDPYHLLTCEHVIDGANLIGLRQQGFADIQAQVVLADKGSDCALLRVDTPLPSYLQLRETSCELLGENIVTLGFPLTGLSSQLQVTQGNIAGLQGLGNDIRFLQFTAPIQPGSSGSPLILPSGEVVGMVTHSVVMAQAQNMNYAVKYQLLSALLASAGINLSALLIDTPPTTTSLSTPKLVSQSKQALWLVGCQA